MPRGATPGCHPAAHQRRHVRELIIVEELTTVHNRNALDGDGPTGDSGENKLLGLILRCSLNHPQLRCLQRGRDLHLAAYLTATTTTGRGQRIEVADMRRLGRLLREGATLVLDDLGPLDATLEIACRALSWWAGETTRVNTYLTTHDASGWSLHWDSHEVRCVQLAGQKSWEVRGPSRPAPMERDTAPNLQPAPNSCGQAPCVQATSCT